MPLEHAAPGTKGFSNNIREMIEAGHPQKQAIAAAYAASGERKDGEPFATGPSPINQSEHPIERALKAAQALYTRSDAAESGRWDGVEDCGVLDADWKASMTKAEALGLLAGTHVRLKNGEVVAKAKSQTERTQAARHLANNGF